MVVVDEPVWRLHRKRRAADAVFPGLSAPCDAPPRVLPPPAPAPPPPPVRRVGPAGALARVAVALCAFAAVCAGLRAVAVPAGGEVIGGKLEYWRAHGAEYDTVFVGSSHVLRAFVPAEFDRVTAAQGVPTKSFNFGVQAVQL